ncbi:MAG: carbohydrate kinase family protein [Candidatus Paceibacterota bacterium]|jgi:sugar/nucleoside kinase (ribokinase family)
MSKNLDFIALGDITTDCFIRLKDASVNCDIDKENCRISMPFKAKVPYELVKVVRSVGNSPNAAVAAARLGLKTGLITNLGDDQNGKECLETIENEGIDSSFVKVNPGVSTNYHYVLWYENDRTILIKHEQYGYELPDLGEPKWLYLSSFGENSLPLHNALAAYLDNHPKINLAFQPGTYQIKFGRDKLAKIYSQTKVFIANKQEAQEILGTKEGDVKKLLESIHSIGPEIVIITDGPEGAYMMNSGATWFMPPFPDEKPPYERTGAGDAFSSTFVAALALGKTPEEALRYGPVNSMNVVQYIGAQEGLLTRKKLEEYLEKSPGYKAKKI